LAIAFPFSRVGLSQPDGANNLAAPCEAKDVKPSVQLGVCDVSVFAVGKAPVVDDQRLFEVDLGRRQRQAMLEPVRFVLRRVKFDLRDIL
jgi:hypothetical protein